MKVTRTLLSSLAILGAAAGAAAGQYAPRYATTAHGALTFTGNALGLSSDGGHLPGTLGSIGAFISTDLSFAVPGGWPLGTTTVWQDNGSTAELRLPDGATVAHAELIWGAHFDDLPAAIATPVTLIAPDGAETVVVPADGLQRTDGSKDFYAHAVDVTAAVAAGGAGTWTVLGVPASLSCTSDCNLRSAGWTLAVAYTHPELPLRQLSLWAGLEPGGAAPATLTGICTPSAGQVRARVLVSALEGDAQGYGDNLAFGPAGGPLTPLSGPNNHVGNFFAAQINDDRGELDVTGSFGDYNLGDGGVGRHGWDITNVDGGGVLPAGTSAAEAQGITSNEQYRVTALGLQIDTGQPIFEAPTSGGAPSPAEIVPGEHATLAWTLTNDGAETAVAPRFHLELPDGLAFVAGSMTVGGAVWPSADPTADDGPQLPDLAPGDAVAVAVEVAHEGGADTLVAEATLSYRYATCDGLEEDGVARLAAEPLTVARLEATLVATPPGPVSPGQPLTLSLSVANVGAAPTRDATARLLLPAGLDYLPGTLAVDGVPAAPDAQPGVSFALGAKAAAPGIIPAGAVVPVTLGATVAPTATPTTLTVTALVDDSATASAPPTPVSVHVPVTICGDGLVGGLEVCDAGAANSDALPDRCRGDCTAARCGDGVVDSGEQCDDGGAGATACAYGLEACEVCGSDCALRPGATSWCGDGVVDASAGEACDDGDGNSDEAPDACRTDCREPRCGDGVVDSGEQCDDGNDDDGDECDNACVVHLCGNGRVDEGEECDDGPGESPPCAYGDADCERCDAQCRRVPNAARWCGDGHLDLDDGEGCDDGNNDLELCRYGERTCAVCGPTCQPTAGVPTWCGDGSVDAVHGEICDDGNTDDGDGCSSRCQPDVARAPVETGCAGGEGRPGPLAWLLIAGWLIGLSRRGRAPRALRA